MLSIPGNCTWQIKPRCFYQTILRTPAQAGDGVAPALPRWGARGGYPGNGVGRSACPGAGARNTDGPQQ